MKKPKKMIVFDNCLECPLIDNCKEWKALTPSQRIAIKFGQNLEVGILKTCKLEDFNH